jgi:integrase
MVEGDLPIPTVKEVKSAQRVTRPWNEDQLGRFLAFSAGDRYGPVWELFAYVGMRRGELLGLQWSDFDFDAKPPTVTIDRSVGESSHQRHIDTAKTYDSRRLIELDDGTVSLLKRWKKHQAEERLAAKEYSEEGWVFTLPDGRGYNPDRLSREFLRKQLTYNRLHPDTKLPRLSLHGLRHTCGSLNIKLGTSVKVVQRQLGHSTAATTLDLYVKPYEGEQAAAANRMRGAVSRMG